MPNGRAADAIVLECAIDVVHPIRARAGDRVVIRPGQDPAVVVVRAAPPNYGALLGLVEGGALTPVQQSADDAVAQLAGLAQPPAPPPRAKSRSPRPARPA